MFEPTIVVVDDQAPFRRALAAVASAAGCRVVGEAEGPVEARVLLAELDRPDLVVVDVRLATSSGIELARELTLRDPALRVVLVSTMDRRDLPVGAADAATLGFVEKSNVNPDLVLELTRREPR